MTAVLRGCWPPACSFFFPAFLPPCIEPCDRLHVHVADSCRVPGCVNPLPHQYIKGTCDFARVEADVDVSAGVDGAGVADVAVVACVVVVVVDGVVLKSNFAVVVVVVVVVVVIAVVAVIAGVSGTTLGPSVVL